MLFSLEWLVSLCPTDAEPREIERCLTARGLTVDSLETTPAGVVLDIDIPANRPDCLGHLGIARELAAGLGAALERRPTPTTGPSSQNLFTVEIEDPLLCPRYTGSLVRGVRIGPSPDWVVRRLEACGLRSINNAVDASNLVLLELGQPIHFFDFERIRPAPASKVPLIRVRLANDGEKLEMLDDVERRLDAEMLVIADGERAIALAGVMGGADSEIGPETRDVLIEAARFKPQSVRSTSRKLGLQTDASFRFERGVDAEGLLAAQELAASLLKQLAAGEPSPGTVDVHPLPGASRTLELRSSRVRRLLGFQPEPEELRASLEALQLSTSGAGERLEVVIPSWRADLEREADLVEEIARHLGYDCIPTTVAPALAQLAGGGEGEREERSRDVLAHLGFHEAFGYAMIGESEDDRFVEAGLAPALALDNPIAEQLSLLRRSILPGLVRAADLNLRRGVRDVRLFEVGHVFLPRETAGAPREPLRIGLAWAGAAEPRHWSRKERDVDLYDLIGVVERVLAGLGPGIAVHRRPGAPAAFHPGRCSSWRTEAGEQVAWGGALHPELQEKLESRLFLAEIELGPLRSSARQVPQHRAPSRLPVVTRDLSLVLTRDLPYARIVDTFRSVPAPVPAALEAIDRYTGPPLEADEVSLTVRLTLEPREKTLTDPETERYRQSVVERLVAELGVRIR